MSHTPFNQTLFHPCFFFCPRARFLLELSQRPDCDRAARAYAKRSIAAAHQNIDI